MAVKDARLYFLPWCPGHRTLVALKGGAGGKIYSLLLVKRHLWTWAMKLVFTLMV